jgi:hypothetical protein
MWSIAQRVTTPKGYEGWVIDNRNPSAILVEHKVEGSVFTESFREDELTPVPERSDKELTKIAAKTVDEGIKKKSKAFDRSSEQKLVKPPQKKDPRDA